MFDNDYYKHLDEGLLSPYGLELFQTTTITLLHISACNGYKLKRKITLMVDDFPELWKGTNEYVDIIVKDIGIGKNLVYGSLGLDVRVGIITMEQNFEDEDETIKFITSLGVTNVGADKMRGIGRGKRPTMDIDPMSQLSGACWKGKLVIDADGKVFPCVFSRFNILGSF